MQYYGFNFLELELACINPYTGEPDRQLVVAVRLSSRGDVAAAYLLKPEIAKQVDILILERGQRS